MSTRPRSKPPQRSNTRTYPRLLTPAKTAQRQLSHSPAGRAMTAATISTEIASKEICRETGTLHSAHSSPTSTESSWMISQIGTTVCGAGAAACKGQVLTADRTWRRPRPKLFVPQGRPVLREILLGRSGRHDRYPGTCDRCTRCRRIRSCLVGSPDDIHRCYKR